MAQGTSLYLGREGPQTPSTSLPWSCAHGFCSQNQQRAGLERGLH